jgi:hypothetical protein
VPSACSIERAEARPAELAQSVADDVEQGSSCLSRRSDAFRRHRRDPVPQRPATRGAGWARPHIDAHAGEALFEQGLHATEIDQVQAPVLSRRDDDIDVAPDAGSVAANRTENVGANDAARLQARPQGSQDRDGPGTVRGTDHGASGGG